jgi:putative endonuclease
MNYFVYILAGKSRTIYIGVTNNLERRVLEHRSKNIPGFTRKYNIHRLVYFEIFGDIRQAIQREKQLKGWKRIKKIQLLEAGNPTWEDLSNDWFS